MKVPVKLPHFAVTGFSPSVSDENPEKVMPSVTVFTEPSLYFTLKAAPVPSNLSPTAYTVFDGATSSTLSGFTSFTVTVNVVSKPI